MWNHKSPTYSINTAVNEQHTEILGMTFIPEIKYAKISNCSGNRVDHTDQYWI